MFLLVVFLRAVVLGGVWVLLSNVKIKTTVQWFFKGLMLILA